MDEKRFALHKTNNWDLVPLALGKSVVDYHCVYKIKTNSNWFIECYKVRFAVKTYSQQYGMDYKETFAPLQK